MAVTVVDNRTIINEADNITGWLGQDDVDTTNYCEATGSMARALNIASGQTYYGTNQDLTDTLIYVYSSNNALQLDWNSGTYFPHALYLGDGTNGIAFAGAGQNRDIFKHSSGPVTWQQHVLDGSMASAVDTRGETQVIAGSFSALLANINAITRIGVSFDTQSKALGGGDNAWVDIIRMGNHGLTIIGGTDASRGNFLDVVNEDKSTATLKAHGIIREYAPGSYGSQGSFTCGSTGSGSSWFDDSGINVIFENRNIADDKYYFKVEGGTAFDTRIYLDGFSLATGGPKVLCDFSSDNINILEITNSVFSGLGRAMTFANDASAESHIFANNTVTGSGIIDPGTTDFNNNNIIATAEPSTSGALLIDIDASLDNLSDIAFTSYSQLDASNHAIYITDPGTYTFTNFTYSGYPVADGSTGGEVVFNNSGGDVIINLSGGDWPSVQNGVDASTAVVNTIALSLTVKDSGGDPIENALAYIDDPANTAPFIMNTTTNALGIASTNWSGGAVSGAYWRVRLYGYKPFLGISDIGTTNKDIPVTLVSDPQQT